MSEPGQSNQACAPIRFLCLGVQYSAHFPGRMERWQAGLWWWKCSRISSFAGPGQNMEAWSVLPKRKICSFAQSSDAQYGYSSLENAALFACALISSSSSLTTARIYHIYLQTTFEPSKKMGEPGKFFEPAIHEEVPLQDTCPAFSFGALLHIYAMFFFLAMGMGRAGPDRIGLSPAVQILWVGQQHWDGWYTSKDGNSPFPPPYLYGVVKLQRTAGKRDFSPLQKGSVRFKDIHIVRPGTRRNGALANRAQFHCSFVESCCNYSDFSYQMSSFASILMEIF